jgi:pimeloyl-ACP methyl ester carboxylesterase
LHIGDLIGTPIIYFYGSPGSRLEILFAEKAAKTYNFRIIGIDRSGMGRSDFIKLDNLVEYSTYVTELADIFSIEKFGLIGISGGGAYALTMAYVMPQRILFVADVCGWAPIYKTGLSKYLAPLDTFFSRFAYIAPSLISIPFSFFGYAAKKYSHEEVARLIASSRDKLTKNSWKMK